MTEKRSPEIEGWANRTRIFKWVQENPCHSQTECALALGLHRRTIGKHWADIKAGWRPPSVARSANRFFSGGPLGARTEPDASVQGDGDA